jgi:hypothetical protein
VLKSQQLGGGAIAPRDEPTFLILPLPLHGLAMDPKHRALVTSVVKSAERCVFRVGERLYTESERVGLRGYGIGLAPAV